MSWHWFKVWIWKKRWACSAWISLVSTDERNFDNIAVWSSPTVMIQTEELYVLFPPLTNAICLSEIPTWRAFHRNVKMSFVDSCNLKSEAGGVSLKCTVSKHSTVSRAWWRVWHTTTHGLVQCLLYSWSKKASTTWTCAGSLSFKWGPQTRAQAERREFIQLFIYFPGLQTNSLTIRGSFSSFPLTV